MIIKGIVEEDFVNYFKPSMVVLMSHCDFKCDVENCHNKILTEAEDLLINPNFFIERYIENPITEALVFSGLEPMLDFDDMVSSITAFRNVSDDMIIIYTGYDENEIPDRIKKLKNFNNIIVKFGRYIPGQESFIDPVLGVELASDNQYAKKIC